MFDKFIEEVEYFLNSNQLVEVDIKPIIEKYLLDIEQAQEKISYFKVRISDLLLDMQQDDLIASDRSFISTLKMRTAGQYSDKPIIIRSTLKFKNYYMNKHKPVSIDNSITQITNGANSPIAGENQTIGNITQESSFKSDHTEENIQPAKKASAIINALKYFADNVIVRIIVGIIIVYICYRLGWKK